MNTNDSGGVKAKKLFVTPLVIATAAIGGLLIGSQFSAYGQAGRLGGSYQLRIHRGDALNPEVVYLATVGSDGSMIVTVPPLSCLPSNASFSTGHGTWGIGVTASGPRIRFQLLSALYISGEFKGFLEISGEAPFPVVSEVEGSSNLSFPLDSECGDEFNGAAGFTAEAIPPVPPDLR